MRKSQFSKPLTIALRPEAFDQVKKITDERQISIAEWIRDVVDMALAAIHQREETINEPYDR